MKKLTMIVAGGSALALVCVTKAISSDSPGSAVTFTGNVPAYCNVTLPPPAEGGGHITQTGNNTHYNFNFGTNKFAGPDGLGLQINGDALFEVRYNASCLYSVASLYGSLKGKTTSAKRKYYIHLTAGANSSPNWEVFQDSGFSLGTFDIVGAGAPEFFKQVWLYFDIPATAQALSADTYEDTLTVTVTPH
jgi:hypothetical protein